MSAMSALEEFDAERKAILEPPRVKVQFFVRSHILGWLQQANEATGVTITDMVNHAVAITGHRLLASQKRGLQSDIRDGWGRSHELPTLSYPFVRQPEDKSIIVGLTQENNFWLEWVQREGLTPELAVDSGIRALGAVAMVRDPEAFIVISDSRNRKETPRYLLNVNLAEAPPLHIPEAH